MDSQLSTFFILGVPAFPRCGLSLPSVCGCNSLALMVFVSRQRSFWVALFRLQKIPKEPASFSPPPSREPRPKWRNLLYKVFLLQPKRHIHQYNQSGNFYQRTDNTRKGLPTIDSKNTNRYRNRQLEIIPRSSKR